MESIELVSYIIKKADESDDLFTSIRFVCADSIR